MGKFAMTMHVRPKLVAETDELGAVTQVSLTLPDWRIAKPEDGQDPLANVLAASEFHGASKQDISDWLHRHWHS